MNFAKFTRLTRIEQTFFSLPFLATSLLMAKEAFHLNHLWILPAFLSARVAGMSFNQAYDSAIDRLNPRTQERVIPSGELSKKTGLLVGWGALALFLLSTFQLHVMGWALLAAALITLYSFMKRFHASCHFVLSAIHGLAPIMGWVVVKGEITWTPLFLGLTPFFLVAAGDIRYAIQDYDFDCKMGLHSIPARIGKENALKMSALLRALGIASLIALALVTKATLFWGAPIVSLFILFRKMKPLQEIPLIGATLFLFTLLETLWPG